MTTRHYIDHLDVETVVVGANRVDGAYPQTDAMTTPASTSIRWRPKVDQNTEQARIHGSTHRDGAAEPGPEAWFTRGSFAAPVR